MIWLSEWWCFAAGLLVLFVPGAIAASIVGLRGFTVAAVAAPLSLAAIGAASVAGVAIPFRWGFLPWVVTATALVAFALLVEVLKRRIGGGRWREISPRRVWPTWLPFVAVTLAIVVMVPRLMSVFADPQDISQTFDNIYHLNAVRFVLDEGMIAPTRQLIPGFYPSLWHALTATVVEVSGASIPAAINVVSILLGGVVWPLSCVYLTREIVGASTVALMGAGVLAAGVGAFPLMMLDFGVLYPNVLSIALLPAVLAALISVAGVGRQKRPPLIVRWILLLAFLPTLALAHPSTLMAFFAIGFWPALAGGLRWYGTARTLGASGYRLGWGMALWLVGVLVVTVLLLVARPTSEQAFWGPSAALWQALGQVLLNGYVFRPVDVTLTIVVLAGVAAILGWRRHLWWLVAGWITLVVIYVVCASFPRSTFRYALTGTWYSDIFRIGALFPTVVVPLGAIGSAAIVTLIAGLAARNSAARRWAVATAGSMGVIVLLALTQAGEPLDFATQEARTMYVMSTTSPLLTTYERDLILRLPEHVAPEELIVGSPWTGTSLSYALADRRALVPHIYAELDAVLPPDTAVILEGLTQAETNPMVCDAVTRTNARWVLDFGVDEIHNGDHTHPGLADLETSSAVELVDSEGPDARLYRITACD